VPRIRSLKIGFFHNETLCGLSPWHRLLYAGLWLLADREGRLEDRPRRIKAELFPYDTLDVDVLLTELAREGFVVRYASDGEPYLAIPRFLKHQKPNIREAASLIPTPDYNVGAVSHVQGQGEWSLGSGLGNGVLVSQNADRPEDLQAAWNEITTPPISRCISLTTKRKQSCRSRLTERRLVDWRDVFARIQASSFCRGEVPQKGSEHDGWRASFDWIMGSPDSAVKVLEGKYDNKVGIAKSKVGSPEYYEGMDYQCLHQPNCGTRVQHRQRVALDEAKGAQ
jgi:hypothetical protein